MPRRTRRSQVAGARTQPLLPVAEALEDRMLLYATLGGNWVHGARITYSFAPDGTNVGGIPSAWYQRMNALGISEQAWKTEFREAAAYWPTYVREWTAWNHVRTAASIASERRAREGRVR